MQFTYTRKKGLMHTYVVTVTLQKRVEDGQTRFKYHAMIHRGTDYIGEAMAWPLTATTEADAEIEARGLIEDDIEDLVNINE